ncbi:MAG: LptF/LptG family permease [Planctomycetes bacterium]|nr:LptF/LptG family permease [Planctomycetota bacterium]
MSRLSKTPGPVPAAVASAAQAPRDTRLGSPPGSTPRRLSGLGRLRIRTMDLYVARIFLAAYAVCTVSFVGLFVLVEAFAKLDRFLRQDSSLAATIFKYHLAMIPTAYANYMGPVLTLAAGMFTMTHLNRLNELTPFKAAGISIYRVMLPVFFLAACLTGLTVWLKEEVLPAFKEPIRSALSLSRARPLNPPPYYDRERGLLIRVAEYSTTRKVAHTVEVSEQHPSRKVKVRIDANQMEWIPAAGPATEDSEEGTWVLHSGSIQRWDEGGKLVVNAAASGFERLKQPFARMELQTSLRPVDLETSDPEISYLSWRDLKRQYQRQPYHRHLAVKLHHQFAFPLSHIVLLFLGIPFVLNLQNRNVFLSLAASFAICALFYLVSSICMNIANQSEMLPPILAAWLPIMLFGSLGITLLDHLPT